MTSGHERSDRRPARDLDDRTQIHDLVVAFYREVVFDDLLAPVFVEVAEVDWSVHLPKLVDYWCRVLLGQPGYEGSMLGPHRAVHDQEPLRAEHFDRWYGLWSETIDSRWRGPIADTAKRHAARMAETLARHVAGVPWTPPDAGPLRLLPVSVTPAPAPAPTTP